MEEDIKAEECEMSDIKEVREFDLREGRAEGEGTGETGKGKGERISSMVFNTETSSAFWRAQIHLSSADLGQCRPLLVVPAT